MASCYACDFLRGRLPDDDDDDGGIHFFLLNYTRVFDYIEITTRYHRQTISHL